MPRLARTALAAVAVLGLVAGGIAVGAAAGSPPQTERERPAAERVDEVTRLQADLVRVPGNHRAWAQLGDAYLRRSSSTADPTDYPKADAAFRKALTLRPEHEPALTGLAALAVARHDFAGAVALTERALAQNANSDTALGVRADALNGLGRYDESFAAVRAMAALRRSVGSATRTAYALELRGDVQRARGALEEAVELAAAPADAAAARYELGELAWRNGDRAAARSEYNRGLEADPTHLPLRAGLARVLAAERQTDAATTELQEVVEEQPKPESLIAYGELLEATGRQDEAQEQYDAVRSALQRHAENGQDVDVALALFEADHGAPEDAVAAAARAYAKTPRSVFAQDAYAWALHKAGRSRQALPVARDALRLGLKSPAMLARVGTVEAGAGDVDAARRTLTRALALNAVFSPLHAPAAQELLASLS